MLKRIAIPIETTELCKYGCGQIAKFKNGSGNLMCCERSSKCPAVKQKNSEKIIKAHSDGRCFGWNKLEENYGINRTWNKGLTKETDHRVEKYTNTKKEKYKSGELVGSFTGKKHTKETKEKISKANSGRNNGRVKVKYYKVFCPYMNTEVTVQGTWELKYANHLNENNIKWEKSRKHNLKYKLFNEDYIHHYYPDFFLIESNTYIEIKGYWFKSIDGRVDDKRKMEFVKLCNSDKNILILEGTDLKEIGITLKM